MEILYIYLSVISLISIIITVTDKIKAKRGAWRISEAALIWISVLGGSLAMIITMLLIRHKTNHNKFMVGIPFIILLQVAAAIAIFFLVTP